MNIRAAFGPACLRKIGNIRRWSSRAEVKEAIPRQNAVKSPIQRQRTHVRDDPFLVRKTVLAHADEGWRRVDASHLAALLDQVAGDWFGRATSDVENGSFLRQEG